MGLCGVEASGRWYSLIHWVVVGSRWCLVLCASEMFLGEVTKIPDRLLERLVRLFLH